MQELAHLMSIEDLEHQSDAIKNYNKNYPLYSGFVFTVWYELIKNTGHRPVELPMKEKKYMY